jgi:hypothetical protein
MDRNILEEQCNTWLKNPIHEFYRDSRDTNGHRPMTMIYYCNFERVFEDPSKSSKNKNLIHYYVYNQTIQKVLNSIEIFYSIFCMCLYLLIIYWNQEDSTSDIILGKYVDEIIDDDIENIEKMDDVLYEEELFEYKMQKNRQMQNRLIDMHMRRGNKNDSRIDYSTFSSFNNDGADSVLRNNVNTSAPYITQN